MPTRFFFFFSRMVKQLSTITIVNNDDKRSFNFLFKFATVLIFVVFLSL